MSAFQAAAASTLSSPGWPAASKRRACALRGPCRRSSTCDLDLRLLLDDPLLLISQDLGEGALDCRLDPGVIEAALVEVAARLDEARLLLVNRFG